MVCPRSLRVLGGDRCDERGNDAEHGYGPGAPLGSLPVRRRRSAELPRTPRYARAPVPGFFLYHPSVARRSAPLRLFVEAAREFGVRAMK
jgi:hypothetical protein